MVSEAFITDSMVRAARLVNKAIKSRLLSNRFYLGEVEAFRSLLEKNGCPVEIDISNIQTESMTGWTAFACIDGIYVNGDCVFKGDVK